LLSEWAPVAPSETSGPAKRSTLYLVDPLGGRYAVTTVSTLGGDLVAWSGDGQRALFQTQTTTSSVVTVLQLPSGRAGTFKIAGSGSRSVSFTEPDGLAIIASGQVPGRGAVRVQRFGLNGALEHTYPASFPRAGRVTVNGGLLYSPDGTELVLGTTHGFEVVANSGQPLRYLPMGPGAGTCQPARWWAAGVLLASCTPPSSIPRLWLVPTNGEPPRSLTATPRPGSGDYGDVDAWSLPGGDYLQDLGACGYIYLARLGRGGRTTPVRVPGTEADRSVYVLGSDGDQLALTTTFSCYPGSASLMWFDPATNVVTPLLGPPVNGGSVGTTLLWGEPPYLTEF
jgi:TolB protein